MTLFLWAQVLSIECVFLEVFFAYLAETDLRPTIVKVALNTSPLAWLFVFP